jgi:hypothetical protein
MAELGWTVLEVTQEHRKNLVSQGYMIAAELVTCHVPKDPASPIQAGGIHCGMRNDLRAGVWCAITPISLLFAAILWPGAASLDPLGELAHDSLCDLVRGLNGD